MPDQPDSQGFLDPGKLSDGRIELVLARKQRPDVVRGWCRAYYFEIRLAVTGAVLGQVSFRAGRSHALDYYSGHIGTASMSRRAATILPRRPCACCCRSFGAMVSR